MSNIDIEIAAGVWSDALPHASRLAEEAAQAAFMAAGRPARTIAILLADDDAVALLNTQFRDKVGPTNVLSFPAAPNPEDHLGDIALAYGVCAREALEQSKPLADHLRHLVAHGVLHLLGYDHETDAQAGVMEDLERAAMGRLGLADPYGAYPHDGVA